MIKKLFLCAALVGAVGLTSCVDDVQSAATQAIHNAKAEQLKAMGEAAKANAEAALIQANAQQKAAETGAAAQQAQQELIKAQAAYLNAQAALEQAKADAQKAQTEIDKQKAEVAIQQALADVEKTKAEVEWTKTLVEQEKAKLQALIAQYEKDMAYYKLQIEKYKNQLADEINIAQGKQYAQLQGLVTDYNEQVEELYRLQGLLTTEIFMRDKYKAGILSWEDGLREEIKGATENINLLGVKKNELAAQKAIYETDDYKNAAAEVEKLNQKKQSLITDKRNANLNYQAKLDGFQSATTAVNESPYMEAVNVFTAPTPTIDYPENVYFVYVDDDGDFEYTDPNASSNPVRVNEAPLAAYEKWCVVEVTEDANSRPVYTITPVFTKGTDEKKQLNALVKENGSIQFYYVINVPTTGNTTYKDLNGQPISSEPSKGPEDVKLEYVYYTYESPYYAINGDGATKLNGIMSKNAKDAKDEEDKASKLYGNMTAQQTAVANAWKDYEAAQEANTAITDPDDPKKADAVKEENAKAQTLWQAMIVAEKAIVDSGLALTGNNNSAITALEAEAPEATDDAAWNTIYSQITATHSSLIKRIDEAVSTTKTSYLVAEKASASAQKNAEIVEENLDAMTTGATAFTGLLDKANKANDDEVKAKAALGAIDAEEDLVQAMIYAYSQLTDQYPSPSLVPIKYVVPKVDNKGHLSFETKEFSDPLNSVANVNKLVAAINSSIEDCDEAITKLSEKQKEWQEDLDAGYIDPDKESEKYNELLQKCEDEIQKLTLEVNAQQAIVDAAQAALEAAIKAINPDASAE